MANPTSTNTSPFQLLESLLQSVRLPTPPAWLIEEGQRRCVLLVNHVLLQEPQATQRLVRQKGRVVFAQWREFNFKLLITPAGLFDLAPPEAPADLTVVLNETSPVRLAQSLVNREKPPVRIEGDVQLAAELNWLADNVQWDLEEDLARVIGDAPAHWVAQGAKSCGAALHSFLASRGVWPASRGTAVEVATPGNGAAASSGGTAA